MATDGTLKIEVSAKAVRPCSTFLRGERAGHCYGCGWTQGDHFLVSTRVVFYVDGDPRNESFTTQENADKHARLLKMAAVVENVGGWDHDEAMDAIHALLTDGRWRIMDAGD